MVTAKRIALQARFATVVTLVGLAIAIVASTAQATSSHSGFMRPNAVLNFYNLLLIWSATLSQKNPWQLKLGCFLPVCVWCTNEIVAATNGGYPNRSIAKWCTQLFIIVVLPILLYQIFKVVAATVRNHRNHRNHHHRNVMLVALFVQQQDHHFWYSTPPLLSFVLQVLSR